MAAPPLPFFPTTAPAPGFFPTPAYSPFVFPPAAANPTAPAYTPTTVFPPSPFVLGAPPSSSFAAPSYGHYTFPSAAIYPPTFPPAAYSYSDEPNWSPFPYPQADAVIPPRTSTNPPHPSSLPSPTFLTTSSSPAQHTYSGRPILSPHHHHFLSTSVHPPVQPTPQLLRHPDQVAGALLATDLSYSSTSLQSSKMTSGCASAGRTMMELHAHEVPRMKDTKGSAFLPVPPDSTCKVGDFAKADGTGSAPTYSTKLPDEKLVHLHHPTTEVPATESSQVALTAPSLGSTPVSGSATQLIGEMPTLDSEHGTHVITAGYDNCCYGYPNQIQSSCVQVGSSNLREKNLAGLPHHYGFDNLKCQSVFLADGTEHIYYALPDTYPLERATPQPVFDVYDDELESVHVFASPPERQSYEEEQQESGQLPKCFSKADIVLPSQQPPMYATATDQIQFQASESMPNYDVYEKEDSACINIISGVTDFTLGLPQQDGERACNYPVLKVSGSIVKRSIQLGVDQSMSKLRQLWDPGALAYLHSSKAKPPGELSYVAVMFPEALPSGNQIGTCVQQLRVSNLNMWVTHKRRKEWDPGDAIISVMLTTSVGAIKLQCIHAYQSEMLRALLPKPDHVVFDCPLQHHQQLYEDDRPLNDFEKHHGDKKLSREITDVKLLFTRPNKAPVRSQCPVLADLQYDSMDVCIWDPGIGISSSMYLWLQGLTTRIAAVKPLFALQISELAIWRSKVTNASYVWDPGTMLLQYKSISLLQFIEEKKKGIPLWLINFQVP